MLTADEGGGGVREMLTMADQGGGGAGEMLTMADKGGRGGLDPPICEQPLTDPPPISFTTLSKKKINNCDM